MDKVSENNQEEKVLTLDDVSKEDLLGAVAELQSQLDEKQQNTFVVEPLLLDDEELIKMFESDEFEEGKRFGYKLAGLYFTLCLGCSCMRYAPFLSGNISTLPFSLACNL